MTDRHIDCFDAGEIGAILSLGKEDPRRRHVDRCARCSGLARLFVAFVETEAVDGDDGREAARELDLVASRLVRERPDRSDLAGRVGFEERARFEDRAGSLDRTAESSRADESVASSSPNAPWWRRGPWIRPVGGLAAAAAVVTVFMVFGPSWWGATDGPPALRGGDDLQAPRPYEAVFLVARVTDDSDEGASARLSWSPSSGADGYVIELRTESLALVTRLGPVADTTLVVSRSALPDDSPAKLLWRVIRMRDGDETVRSRVMRLAWPAE